MSPLKIGQRATLSAGPWKGVYASKDPFDTKPGFAVDAKNVRSVDPGNTSGFYARPQFRQLNVGTPVYAPVTPFRTQCIYTHTQLDGSPINLLVIGGRLFRVALDLSTFTDVTPVGVTIDPGISTRVFFASLVGTLTVNDSINRPWVATNLDSTPITGTYIDYDGSAVPWTAYGAPRVYQGSVFFILNTVNGISRRADISWSASGDPTLGWQQPTYDNNWTLSQNEAGVLYALIATNTALYYLREQSIGSVSGQDTDGLASTATDDAVAFNIGSQASQMIQKYGDGFFFGDAQGRPYWLVSASAPESIWQQMRTFVDEGTANNPTTTAVVATSVLEPTYNLYCVAIWSPTPATQAPPTDIHVYDARTRIYQGHWSVSDDQPVECLGTWLDGAGRATLIAFTSGGYGWALSPLGIEPANLVTESLLQLTTEAGNSLVTEGSPSLWEDDGAAQDTFVLTDYLGAEENTVINIDMATVICSTAVPVEVTTITATESATVQATPVPGNSQNGTYRSVAGCNAFGRFPQIQVSPGNYNEQFILQKVNVAVVPSLAAWNDP